MPHLNFGSGESPVTQYGVYINSSEYLLCRSCNPNRACDACRVLLDQADCECGSYDCEECTEHLPSDDCDGECCSYSPPDGCYSCGVVHDGPLPYCDGREDDARAVLTLLSDAGVSDCLWTVDEVLNPAQLVFLHLAR